MSFSAYSILLAVVLLFECHTDSIAVSAAKIEDSRMLNDAFSHEPFLNEEVVDKGISTVPSNRYLAPEGTVGNEGGNSKIFIFTDFGMKKNYRGLYRPALSMDLPARQLPYYTVRELDAEQPEKVQAFVKEERRDTESDLSSSIPVGRRDFDMLRCMLGRVYRPCWQV
ncbi:pro-MCH [Lepisosteus oculatus]|uniref:pro-MCH n=1 Tax=Lepisosteus oculatus TaxID=7918 RepID=UPI003721FE16